MIWGPPQNKVSCCFHCFPTCLPWSILDTGNGICEVREARGPPGNSGKHRELSRNGWDPAKQWPQSLRGGPEAGHTEPRAPAKGAGLSPGHNREVLISSEQRSGTIRPGRPLWLPHGGRVKQQDWGWGAGVSQGAAEKVSWRQLGEGEKGYSLGPDRYPQIQTRLCWSTSTMTLQSMKKLLIIALAKNKWDSVWPSDLQGLRHCRNISYRLFNYRSIIKSNHYFTLLSFIPIPDNQRQKIAHSQSLKASLVPLLSVNLGSPLNLWNGDTILLFAYFSGLPGGLIWRADIQEL